MNTKSSKSSFENITFRNNQSLKDFIEKKDPIKVRIINSEKIQKEMDKTHQRILNPFTRRKQVK